MRSALKECRDRLKKRIDRQSKHGHSKTHLPPRVPTIPYDYAELHQTVQIRILHLRLGRSDQEPLVGDLESRMLEDERPYITVSYVWGKKDLSHRIKTSSEESIFITESLFYAILDIRSWARGQQRFRNDNTIPIWADAICINQAHVEERNVQVGLMSTIYRRAQLLITYLGPAIPSTKAAIDLAAQLHEWLETYALEKEDDITLKLLEKAGFQGRRHDSWNGLIDLFSRTWYSRVWLLQESVLSQSHDRVMLCGPYALPRWPSLIQLWSVIFSHGGPDLVVFLKLRKSDRMSSVAQMITMRFLANPSSEFASESHLPAGVIEQLPRRDWSNLLFISHFLRSHDPRDKVYGLLGLVQDSWTPTADYNLPPELVYEDACVSMLKHSGSLDFLYCVYPKKSDGMKLPSWVPDWSHVPHDCPIPIRGYGFSASGSTKVAHVYDRNSRSLTLIGIVIGTIADVILEADVSRSVQHHRTMRSSKREELSREGRIYSESECELFWESTNHLRHEIIMAFDADITATGLRTLHSSVQSSSSTEDWKRAGKSDRARPTDAETMDDEDAATLRNTMADRHYASLNFFFGSFSGNRPLLRTSKGAFALGPRNAEPGDLLLLLHGARTPFVVKKSKEKGQWQFKGFALVDGYMYGEGIEDAELKAEHFTFI